MVIQLEVYYKLDRLLTGPSDKHIGTTARWYSIQTSLVGCYLAFRNYYFDPPTSYRQKTPGFSYNIVEKLCINHCFPALTQNHVAQVYPSAPFVSTLPLPHVLSVPGHLLSVYQVEHPPADIITPDGLKIEVVSTSVQCPRRVSSGDLVTAHYTGTLESGEVFDSSKGEDGQGEPIKFVIGTKSQ